MKDGDIHMEDGDSHISSKGQSITIIHHQFTRQLRYHVASIYNISPLISCNEIILTNH